VTTRVADVPDRKRYEISEDGECVGFVTYRLRPGLIDFVHTKIDPDHEGRGLAGILVRTALDDARARGLQVLPHCPYIASFIREHRDEYEDLVPEARRHEFGLGA